MMHGISMTMLKLAFDEINFNNSRMFSSILQNVNVLLIAWFRYCQCVFHASARPAYLCTLHNVKASSSSCMASDWNSNGNHNKHILHENVVVVPVGWKSICLKICLTSQSHSVGILAFVRPQFQPFRHSVGCKLGETHRDWRQRIRK